MSRPTATTTHGKPQDFLRITMSRRQGRPEAGRGIRGCEALQETKNPCADGRNGLGPVKILSTFEHFGKSPLGAGTKDDRVKKRKQTEKQKKQKNQKEPERNQGKPRKSRKNRRGGQSRPEPARPARPARTYVAERPESAGQRSSGPGIRTAVRVAGPPQIPAKCHLIRRGR